MPTTHRKLHRKELRQPDEFQSFFENLSDFTLANLTRIIFVSVAVVIIVVVVGGAYLLERHREQVVSDRFYTALSVLNAGQYKAAEGQFQKLAKDDPGFRLGRLARLYLANAYIGQNDYAKARDALVAYLAHNDEPLFRSLALNELGVVYENMGDFKKAGAAYRQAAGIPGPQQTRSEIAAARMLILEGNRKAGIAAYRKFLKAHPFSQEQGQVTSALAQLGASPEAEKPAPKTAEKTTAGKTSKASPAAQASAAPKTATSASGVGKPKPPTDQGASKPPAANPSSK